MQRTHYLRDTDLAERYRVHRVTIWKWVSAGKFPEPVKVTEGSTRWRLADVEAWERSRGLVAETAA